MEYEQSKSTLEKLTLLVCTAAIVIGNFCVFVTYLVSANMKHWSNIFILGMAFIDMFIGGFVLPIRYLSSYGSSISLELCTALIIGESCAIGAVIYSILFMILVRLYDLKQPKPNIQHGFLVFTLIASWVILFLFYGIPSLLKYPDHSLSTLSSTSNETLYCSHYISSIYHPVWMLYTEIGTVYTVPILLIIIGIMQLSRHLCKSRPRRLARDEREGYLKQRQMTWHVFTLACAFLLLCLPWISVRILVTFSSTGITRLSLQVTFYVFILKSVLFPILYASTNSAFRGSFAIYRHQRITLDNRVWSVNDQFGYSINRARRGY